ncbi:MAG: hypothetical protein C0454_01660 [Parvibaculum sp.]|nr:hypothetical protein [Parvibaculum sp.]
MSETGTIAAEAPSRQRIEQRAYEIWMDEGCPTGCELEHWLRAESEISLAVSKPEQHLAEDTGSKKKV